MNINACFPDHKSYHSLPCSYTTKENNLIAVFIKKKKKHQFCYYFNCWFIGRKFIRKFSVVSLTSAFNHFNFFRQKATEKQSQKPHNPNIFSVKIFSLQSIFFMYACHARRMKRAHLHFYVQSPSTQ